MSGWAQGRFAAFVHRSTAFARRLSHQKGAVLLAAATIAAASYVVIYPFTLVTYPPITDLPFHAAFVSIFRHFFDPAWHFREQFSFHPLESPYVSAYALGALFACVMSITAAVKGMTIVMLGLLPVGLAVMFHGMRKSPLWGVLGLTPVWCALTHWGFLNFIGAVGLFAMVVGFALLALDRPSRRHRIGLTLALLAVFFTHIYRFPFALAAVVGTAIVMYPATRRVRPVLVPMAIALGVFLAWTIVRPRTMGGELGPLAFHWERVHEIMSIAFGGYTGVTESKLVEQMGWVVAGAFGASTLLFFLQGRHRGQDSRRRWWALGVTVLPLLMSAAFLGCYFVLPMSIGIWWYVYPREIVTAMYVALGVVPDLPRQSWLKLPFVAAIAIAAGRLSFYNAEQWSEFEQATADFRAIEDDIPPAPKLMYLVFDHSGSMKLVTPFIHLPAWIQAQKGGWLSFHQAATDILPIRYREAQGPNVPPPRPLRWEWTPEKFDLKKDGPWFDTFLVRSRWSPDHLFAGDPDIVPVRHVGTWWLYRRHSAPALPPSAGR